MYTIEQRKLLLQIARQSIKNALSPGSAGAMPPVKDPELQLTRGAFVTLLHMGRQLRGCIGIIEAIAPLAETIYRTAVSAALQDPRFPPVAAAELPELTIEISVLSPLQPIDPADVVVGTHGLVVEQLNRRGLLLPQVPAEFGWNCMQFLEHTCLKAGLSANAWREGAILYSFTAEVFSEE